MLSAKFGSERRLFQETHVPFRAFALSESPPPPIPLPTPFLLLYSQELSDTKVSKKDL